tara:strand:+ start:516 stop:1091 length:576 start_codon:yes stop_codon:yes gene_type:complete
MHIYNKIYHFIDEFKENELEKISIKNISIIYRNYINKINFDEIIKLKKYCKKRGYKLFLANNIKLAWKLDLDGAYIPSFNKKFTHNLFATKKNFLLIGSSHNLSEILLKEKQGCKEIFLSPIFQIKKKNNYLGLSRFRILSRSTNTKIIALGGINNKNLKKLKISNASGFASISYIKKNGPDKLGRFNFSF